MNARDSMGHGARLVVVIVLCFLGLSVAAINPIWTLTDKRLIKGLGRLDHSNPAEVADYFAKHRNGRGEREIAELGFGWKVWYTGFGGGYVGVKAKFYYLRDSLVAYELIPEMPTEPKLKERYRAWYAATFRFDGDSIRSRGLNMEALEEPLPQYSGLFRTRLPADSIRSYMSPTCGTRYGFRGGYGNRLTTNRAYFKNIKDQVDDDALLLMMYAINPATRLTAIEYYYHRTGHAFGDAPEVDAWVHRVFEEVPQVSFAIGCLVETTTAHQAVALFGSFTEELYKEK
jgi:hypothetical protein